MAGFYIFDFLTDPRNEDVASACLIQPMPSTEPRKWRRHWFRPLCLQLSRHVIGRAELSISRARRQGSLAVVRPGLPQARWFEWGSVRGRLCRAGQKLCTLLH